MNRDNAVNRFEELDAGRALGDLDAAETAEWSALARELGHRGDPAFDRIAAEMEVSAVPRIEMPAALAARLKASIPVTEQVKKEAPPVSIVPWLGWAAAACLAVIVGVTHLKKDSAPDLTKQRADLLENAPDVRTLPFAGASAAYGAASGTVVWSDARQQGFMTLSNLPANDPARKQYQLWIVDPTRDEIPVDGGVFDIPAGPGPVVIPIEAKLAVNKPAAFVITLEQPGGVVRSKQETVVALAKF
jgi:anti-sigma-K factor RskA